VDLWDRQNDSICVFIVSFAKDKNKDHLSGFCLVEHFCFAKDFQSLVVFYLNLRCHQAYFRRIRLLMDMLDLSCADCVSGNAFVLKTTNFTHQKFCQKDLYLK
jgi:hypothetical protein